MNMRNISVLFLLTAGLHIPAVAQLLTTPEKTEYTSTSTYADVIEFTNYMLQYYDNVRQEIMAVSVEGREIPLFILADPMPESPTELENDHRLVVYIQANIHAGEVEGKEAAQMLMRDLLSEDDTLFFQNIILLVCPILNPDGNDKISKEHRTNQIGPVNGVGVRYNGQNLDLNRDAMKLETPEIRGVVWNVFNRWDPAITVDCHTTNGSYHEEPVTFTWMMNPNGDRNLINFMRDDMMPEVHKSLYENYNVENVFYGEFADRMNVDTSWISYAAKPRYLVNYVGVRNRLAILNENYVYADFKTRVNGCYHLLKTIVDYAVENKDEIQSMIKKADRKMKIENLLGEPELFALGYEGRPTPEPVTIKAIEADTIPGVKGYWRYKQSNRKRTVTVPYIADYYPTNEIQIPFAYLLTAPDPDVLFNLKLHGIGVEKLQEKTLLPVQRFEIKELNPTNRLYQGHYLNSVKGEFVQDTVAFDRNTFVIYTAQILGNLAAYLLEPESDDGYLTWNFFDKYLVPQWGRGYLPYPVYKLNVPAGLKSEPYILKYINRFEE